VVAGVDADVLREGETVEVNGSKGTLTIPGVEEVRVVTALLEREDGRILLLERSSKVGSFQGRWAGVSGFLEDPTPLDQAYREIREEVGLGREGLRLEVEGAPVLARDGARVFVVHPFRFRALTTEIRLDWEHVRAEWVDPVEIRRRPTVPKLDRVWEAVRATGAPKG
jgi:ADP-ribose pyrophosphatase YjhB (NUDIX family)